MSIPDNINDGWYQNASHSLRDDIEREFFGFHKHPNREQLWNDAYSKALSDAHEGGIESNNGGFRLIYIYYKESIDAMDHFERHLHLTCPHDPNKQCLSPGPTREGGCCHVIQSGPTGFSVGYRNPGHWDVYTKYGRAFRIRGEEPNVVIFDERTNDSRREQLTFKNVPLTFKSVSKALSWCADELMDETK
jgi:hypothetical protein